MNDIGLYIAAGHNGRLANDIQNKLNAFIEAINKAGGKCWLQSKSNKEHYYELTEPVYFNYYQPVDGSNNTAMQVHITETSGIVKEKENG